VIEAKQSTDFRVVVSYGGEIVDIAIDNWGEDCFHVLWEMLYERLLYMKGSLI